MPFFQKKALHCQPLTVNRVEITSSPSQSHVYCNSAVTSLRDFKSLGEDEGSDEERCGGG